jgi:hypothetical protein
MEHHMSKKEIADVTAGVIGAGGIGVIAVGAIAVSTPWIVGGAIASGVAAVGAMACNYLFLDQQVTATTQSESTAEASMNHHG